MKGRLVSSVGFGLALVFSSVLAVFWQTSTFEFLNFDDPTYVFQNPHVATGLTAQNIAWAFTTPYAGHWHPLAWISHMLDVELFGLSAGPHHLVNAALHALNSALLYLFVFGLTRRPGVALVSALLFGIHPLRIESVAWVSERKDVLSMLFGLLALNLYLLFVRTRSRGAYALMVASLALSLLAKPTFVSFPALLLLCDAWPLARAAGSLASLRALVVEKLPLIALSLAFCAVAAFGQSEGGGLQDLSGYPLSDRLAGGALAYLVYAGKTIFPAGVGVFYPFARYAPGIGAGAFFGLAAVTTLVAVQRHERPYLTWGWAWLLISALPFVGFVQIGGQAFADRWSYLPGVGILVATVLLFASSAHTRSWSPILGGAAVAASVLLTVRELPHWRSSETLFTRTLQVSPNNFMAHTNLGTALRDRGASDLATVHFEEAVRLNPTYPEALNNLAISRAEAGRFEEAQQLFSKALAIRPDFDQARYNSALAFSFSGNTARASIEWAKIVAHDPSYTAAQTSLNAVASQVAGMTCAQFRESLRTAPPEAREELSASLGAWPQGLPAEGIRASLSRLARCDGGNEGFTP